MNFNKNNPPPTAWSSRGMDAEFHAKEISKCPDCGTSPYRTINSGLRRYPRFCAACHSPKAKGGAA